MSCKYLTTGVLNKNAETKFAHIEVLNLDDCAHTVNIKVVNWTNPTYPSEITVIPAGTLKVEANTAQFFNASLPTSPFRYEVRVKLYDSDNVIVNIFGVADPCLANTNQEGNTVLFNDLVELEDEDDDD